MARAFKRSLVKKRLYSSTGCVMLGLVGLLLVLPVAQAQTPAPGSAATSAPTSSPTAQKTQVSLTPTPLGFLTPTPAPTVVPQTTAQYRAKLRVALDSVKKVERTGPRDVRTLLKPLDAVTSVKRDDGKSQRVDGDYWAQKRIPLNNYNPAKLTRPQSNEIKGNLQDHVGALEDWTTKRDGRYYQNLDTKKLVDQLKISGQIRISPPAWEVWTAHVLDAIGNAFSAFFRWLASLMPTPPRVSAPPVDASWVLYLFYGIVAALISFLLFLAIRSLQGKGFTFWRRARKSAEELADEDAELFQLPPDELMDRASRYAAQGNFREALRHRFISLLVFLDGRGVWRYDVRRTNWEHIAQLRRSPRGQELVNPLSDLTRRFDRVRYGGAPCDPESWQQFKQDADQLEALAGGRGGTKSQKREVARV